MSEEQKQEAVNKPAEAQVEEKKEAQGQGVYHVYCPKCGWTGYYHDYGCYCPKTGCTGRLVRM